MFNLKGLLQNPNGEILDWVSGKPEPKIRMGFSDPLQTFLQILKPLHHQVAILQHKPMAT